MSKRQTNILTLQVVTFDQIKHWLPDFKKKAGYYEEPTPGASILGIFVDDLLVGYFVLQGYEDKSLEIQQGYLKPLARHKRISYLSMKLLQEQAKKAGFTKIILKASRALKAYSRFMTDLGFTPEVIIFSKQVG